MNRKRIIFIGTGILAFIGIIVAGYLFRAQQNVKPGESPTGGGLPFFSSLFSGNTAVTPPENNNPSGGGEGGPDSGNTGTTQLPKLMLVASNPVLNYFIDKDGNAVLVQPDGQIFSVVSGAVNTISNAAIPGISEASFSYNGRKILLKTGSEDSTRWSVFDITTRNSQPLPNNIRAAAWSPSDYRIAYLAFKSAGVYSLSILDLAAKTPKPISLLTLHEQDMDLLWPASNQVVLTEKASAYAASALYRVDISKRTMGVVVDDALGLVSMWNQGGNKALVFYGNSNNVGGALKILSASGAMLHSLNLLTLPSKCAFNLAGQETSTMTESLVCAVPRDPSLFNLPLPDAYQKHDIVTADNIVSFGLVNGAVVPVFDDPSGIADVTLSRARAGKFFFVNRLDQKLYSVLLPPPDALSNEVDE